MGVDGNTVGQLATAKPEKKPRKKVINDSDFSSIGPKHTPKKLAFSPFLFFFFFPQKS